MNNSLIRPSKDKAFQFAPETVVVIGNGIIEGESWAPIKKAISNDHFLEMTKEEKESYLKLDPEILLSHIAYFSRLSFLNMFKDRDYLDDSAFASKVNLYEKDLNKIEKLRVAIANEYKNSFEEGELRLREIPNEISKLMYSSNVGVITTNWDECLWNNPKIENLIQLHGRNGLPKSLILPTESMIDHDNIRYLHRSPSLTLKDEILIGAYDRASRGEDLARELFLAYEYSRYWVRSAKNLILYGIAGHIYDAELHSLFIGEQDRKKDSIQIVNPCNEHVERWKAILRCETKL